MTNEINASEIIRSFRSDPSLVATYISTAANPYREKADIDIYDDQHGFEYWLDAATSKIVQAGPRAGLCDDAVKHHASVRATSSDLRAKAVALVKQQEPTIDLSKFHPFEDNRRGQIFFFRWESGPLNDFELPPFIQVGLFADGALACFTDTLTE